MKKIKLTVILNQPDGSYSVHLGNGTSHSFSSEKSAQHFINNTNKFLTDAFTSLWKHYKEIAAISNQYYPFFDSKNDSREANLERQIEQLVKSSKESFDLCYKRADYQNGNHFSFLHLYNVCDNLKNAISIIAGYSLQKRITIQLYDFRPTLKGIISVETELNEYGQNKATAYFTRPQHRDLAGAKEYQPKLKVA